jgi:hypothetical protein
MNSKNSILLVDPEFDPNTAAECDLLIKVGPDSFSYAIIDKSCNQVKAVYDQQECEDAGSALAAKLKSDNYLSLSFKAIKVAVYTENTIAIPDEVFDPAGLNQYTKYFSEEQSGTLYVQPLADYGFTSIFNLTEFIEDTLSASLTSSKRYDQSAPLLALAKGKVSRSLLLDFTVGSFNVTYVNEGRLVFQRCFHTENAEELNYYLLLIINQLKMDNAQTTVHLSGIIHENDSNYRCISKYFRDIHFTKAVSNELDSRILDDMPAHYYSSLLALDLCE